MIYRSLGEKQHTGLDITATFRKSYLNKSVNSGICSPSEENCYEPKSGTYNNVENYVLNKHEVIIRPGVAGAVLRTPLLPTD